MALAPLCRQDRPDALVAIGPEAAQAAAQECPVPLLVVRVSRQQVAPWLAEGNPGSARRSISKPSPRSTCGWCGPCYPPLARWVLVPTPAPGWLAPLDRGAPLGLHVGRDPVTDDLGAVRALRPRLPGLDAVLLPPDDRDQRVVAETAAADDDPPGRAHLRWVDRAVRRCGVFAAVVADEERLPEQMQTVVAELARDRAPAPVYPAAVRVAVDATVAQTLGVPAEAVARARRCFRDRKHAALFPWSLSSDIHRRSWRSPWPRP